ncbi:SRPBCC family protein [Chloroflexota bacterium]
MTKIERDILINALIEKVFTYLDDPVNLMESQPGVTDIRNINGRGIGQTWEWDYKMMGIPFKGKAEITRLTLNTELTIKTTGGISSVWAWRFKRHDEGTLLSLEIEYTIPVPVLGKVGELLITQRNERVADMAMLNIKERLEN